MLNEPELYTTFGVELEIVCEKDAWIENRYDNFMRTDRGGKNNNKEIDDDDSLRLYYAEKWEKEDKKTIARRHRDLELMPIIQELQSYRYFSIISDQSLQKPDDGVAMEIVSPIIGNTNYHKTVSDIKEIVEKLSAYSNDSCGMHIHIGVNETGLKPEDHLLFMKNMAIIYLCAEDNLDNALRPSNRYAKALGNGTNDNILRDDITSCDSLHKLKNVLQPDGDRFYKFNLEAYDKHGTIEIRHHDGFRNVKEMESWIEHLNGFVKIAVQNTKNDHILTLREAQNALHLQSLEKPSHYNATYSIQSEKNSKNTWAKSSEKLELLKETLKEKESTWVNYVSKRESENNQPAIKDSYVRLPL